MSDKKKPESLLVMPVSGKYCEIISGQASYKVWKVHPNTPDSYGTLLPYDVAVEFLCKTPPSITVVPNTKDGKFVSQLLEEDQERIKESLARGFSSRKSLNEDQNLTGADIKDPKAFDKVSKSLQENLKENAVLKDTLAKLNSRLEQLEAANKLGVSNVPK